MKIVYVRRDADCNVWIARDASGKIIGSSTKGTLPLFINRLKREGYKVIY